MKQWTVLFLLVFATTFTDATASPHVNWMNNIPSERVINQLIIPGSHNSGTTEISASSKFSFSSDDPLPIWIEAILNILPKTMVQSIVAGWSKTQPFSIQQQLEDGIRYLDFRVCFFQNSLFISHFYLCHALLGDRLRSAFAQIASFAKNHPSEIILVDLNHIYNVGNSEEETRLVQLIQQYLGNFSIPNTYHPNDTMSQLRQSHRQLIIFMDSNQAITDPTAAQFAANDLWHDSAIYSPWPNASNMTDLKNALDMDIALRHQTYLTSDTFFVLQMIQTENTAEVVNGILYPAFAHTIEQFELPVNISLTNWINQYIAEYGVPTMNIVMQDWYTNRNGLVALAIQYDTQTIVTPEDENNAETQEKLAELKNWFGKKVH